VFAGETFRNLGENRFQMNPVSENEEIRRVMETVETDSLRGIVHLWSLDGEQPEEPALEQIHAVIDGGCGHVLRLIKAMGRMSLPVPLPIWLVTGNAQPVLEGDVPAISQSTLWGFGKTLAMEHYEWWGGLIDLDAGVPADQSAMLLVEELTGADSDDQIAFRGTQRYVARLCRMKPAPGPVKTEFDPLGKYLITGGLGGLGLEVARWMIGKGAKNIILMNRSAFPPRSEWDSFESGSRRALQAAAIRDMENAGAEVELVSFDVGEGNHLDEFMQTVRSNGFPIRGVVHAAGIMQYQSIDEHDAESMRAIMKPKVDGSWLLHRSLQDMPLDFFIMFSSASTVLSSPLVGSYAAANAFIDSLAHYRKRHGLHALSINWATWSETGMALDYRAHAGSEQHTAKAALSGGIPTEKGLRALERLMAQDFPQIGVMVIDWNAWSNMYGDYTTAPYLEKVLSNQKKHPSEKDTSSSGAALIVEGSPEERARSVTDYIHGQVERILKLSSDILLKNQSISGLGFDSLMAIELKNKIETDTGAVIPMVRFLNGPTVEELAELVLQELSQSETSPAAARTKESGVSWEEGEI
jgi:NAD(P)-dependent dehydrogenase (short-subunit alcohol dehydrogenase family)/acyl carrier protein